MMATLRIHNKLNEFSNNVPYQKSKIAPLFDARDRLVGDSNLVTAAKDYADHEEKTLGSRSKPDFQVARARGSTVQARQPAEVLEYDVALGRMITPSEKPPTLQANENYRDVQTKLTAVQSEIVNAHNNYSKAVNDYNNYVQSFPVNVVAGIFGFPDKK